jgi:hypothetical protein
MLVPRRRRAMATVLQVTDRKDLYKATAEPRILDVPAMDFLMVDGTGDPETSSEYREALQALFGISYTLRFSLKKERAIEYKVGPLEGLWWADDPAAFSSGDRGGWHWTAMIVQPDLITEELVRRAANQLGAKKDVPSLERVRLEWFEEGRCAQVMHIGTYDAEGPTIERLHAFIRERGYGFDGRHQKHHEIYLGDPRRAAPEKLRTIIRQPFV